MGMITGNGRQVSGQKIKRKKLRTIAEKEIRKGCETGTTMTWCARHGDPPMVTMGARSAHCTDGSQFRGHVPGGGRSAPLLGARTQLDVAVDGAPPKTNIRLGGPISTIAPRAWLVDRCLADEVVEGVRRGAVLGGACTPERQAAPTAGCIEEAQCAAWLAAWLPHGGYTSQCTTGPSSPASSSIRIAVCSLPVLPP